MTGTYRIGCGAGFAADRLPPAVELLRHGRLDCMILECIGERTLAFAHRHRRRDPDAGYNAYLEQRMRALLPIASAQGTKIVTNMGVANPLAAGERTVAIARELGLLDLRVAVLVGDDVTEWITPETPLWEGGAVGDQDGALIGANAYLGAEAMLEGMAADVLITGRVADPSLVLAPLMAHFGWALDDWPRLGAGTLAGHLLECGMQVTGGYFADPGFKDVPDLAACGYPLAEIAQDGAMIITKLEQAGGCVTMETVKEQLLYEVHDPTGYLTPDVAADFSGVALSEVAEDRVAVAGATGRTRPPMLKATVSFDGGFLAEAGVSYAGPGAGARAALARQVLSERLAGINVPLRIDLVGANSLHSTAHGTAGTANVDPEARDVRLRAATRTNDPEIAETILWETEALLCCGPAGGGGFRRSITPSVVTASASIPRDLARPRIEWMST